MFIPQGFTSSWLRNPLEELDAAGNCQLIDEESDSFDNNQLMDADLDR
jgi:hypothetical protein